jgi:phosphoribosylformylglycinamidine (FGAM) synthase-like enzyme
MPLVCCVTAGTAVLVRLEGATDARGREKSVVEMVRSCCAAGATDLAAMDRVVERERAPKERMRVCVAVVRAVAERIGDVGAGVVRFRDAPGKESKSDNRRRALVDPGPCTYPR